MKVHVSLIRKEFGKLANKKGQQSAQKFHKEKIKSYGIKMPVVRQLAKYWFMELRETGKDDIFSMCDELLQSAVLEEAMVAIEWTVMLKKQYEEKDFERFEKWIAQNIHSWSTCDNFCNNTIGNFLGRYPSYVSRLKKWAVAENRWLQRAAAVSLILPARKGKFLRESLAIAKLELQSDDDLVQKGYGWLLKVASKPHLEEVYRFLTKHKHQMPRTALRYAIEHFPQKKKLEIMAR